MWGEQAVTVCDNLVQKRAPFVFVRVAFVLFGCTLPSYSSRQLKACLRLFYTKFQRDGKKKDLVVKQTTLGRSYKRLTLQNSSFYKVS